MSSMELQQRILAGTVMVDEAQACELITASELNNNGVLRFTTDGRAVYPLFQFDVEGRRIYPVIAQLIAMMPAGWSNFRLLHWLTQPHLDLDGTPADRLATNENEVISAFGREIEPISHG